MGDIALPNGKMISSDRLVAAIMWYEDIQYLMQAMLQSRVGISRSTPPTPPPPPTLPTTPIAKYGKERRARVLKSVIVWAVVVVMEVALSLWVFKNGLDES
jgi:hypothetical protein